MEIQEKTEKEKIENMIKWHQAAAKKFMLKPYPKYFRKNILIYPYN